MAGAPNRRAAAKAAAELVLRNELDRVASAAADAIRERVRAIPADRRHLLRALPAFQTTRLALNQPFVTANTRQGSAVPTMAYKCHLTGFVLERGASLYDDLSLSSETGLGLG